MLFEAYTVIVLHCHCAFQNKKFSKVKLNDFIPLDN